MDKWVSRTLHVCGFTAVFLLGLPMVAMAEGTFELIACGGDPNDPAAECRSHQICAYPTSGPGSVCDELECGELGVCVKDFGLIDGIDTNRYPCRFVGHSWGAPGLPYDVNCSIVVPDDPANLRPEFVVETLNWYGDYIGEGPERGEPARWYFFPEVYPWADRLGYISIGWEVNRYLGDEIASWDAGAVGIPGDVAAALRTGEFGDLELILEGAGFDHIDQVYGAGTSQTGWLMWYLAERSAGSHKFDIYFPIVRMGWQGEFADEKIIAIMSENDLGTLGPEERDLARQVAEESSTIWWYEIAGGSHVTVPFPESPNPHPMEWDAIAGTLVWKAIMGEAMPPNAYVGDCPGWRAPWAGPFDPVNGICRDPIYNTSDDHKDPAIVHPEAAAGLGTFIAWIDNPGVFLGNLFGGYVDRSCDIESHRAYVEDFNDQVACLKKGGYLDEWWADMFFTGVAEASDIGQPGRCDCVSDADCPDGLFCAGDHCVTCLEDDHCPGWLFCEDNQCVALIDAIAEITTKDDDELALRVRFDYDGPYAAVAHGPAPFTIDGSIMPGPIGPEWRHEYGPIVVPEGSVLFVVELSGETPDLDLMVRAPDGSLAGYSFGASSFERVEIVDPDPGDYTVIVERYSIPHDVPYAVQWTALGEQTEGIEVHAPRRARDGKTKTVEVEWSEDLDPGLEYLMLISHHFVQSPANIWDGLARTTKIQIHATTP